jgi:lycopene beta-cyclase
MKHYDYIITGGGCAGLSLAMRMAKDDFFSEKKILIIEENGKTQNDRTWCFWEKEIGFFEEIVSKKWQYAFFKSNFFDKKMNLAPYDYKMIGGLDFYNYCKKTLENAKNISFLSKKIELVNNDSGGAYAIVDGEKIYSDYIFNSILFQSPNQAQSHNLLQHFKGWYIETETPFFNPDEATLMDFRIEQKNEVRFCYTLPLSDKKALVEFTIFSPQLLENEKLYDNEVAAYLRDFLKLEKFEIYHQEFGTIPMTNAKFAAHLGENIINIGIASGMARPSTGYTFMNIQRQCDELIERIKTKKSLDLTPNWWQKRHFLYDSAILNVMRFNKYSGAKLFSRLFKWNSPKQILKFLDGKTNFLEEYRIMNTTPIYVFLPIVIKEMFAKK